MNERAFSVEWTDFSGTWSCITVSRKTTEEAETAAFEEAKHFGWTPRKWWQWWRWDDTPNPKAS